MKLIIKDSKNLILIDLIEAEHYSKKNLNENQIDSNNVNKIEKDELDNLINIIIAEHNLENKIVSEGCADVTANQLEKLTKNDVKQIGQETSINKQEVLQKENKPESQEKSVHNKKVIKEEVLTKKKSDRRILPNVPDPNNVRTNKDRRGLQKNNNHEMYYFAELSDAGERFYVECDVNVKSKNKINNKREFNFRSVDISATGMLIKGQTQEDKSVMDELFKEKNLQLKFKATPGSMPEGYENKVNVNAHSVRKITLNGDIPALGVEFNETLPHYINRTRGRYLLAMSAMLLIFVSAFVILMRAESVIYFRFNRILYLYSIIAAVFLLSRYLFGMLYKPVPVNMNFTPSVTIIIPCFNEEEWIERTIISCINQDYPPEQLQVIVVDDCSSDKSVEVIERTVEKIRRESNFGLDDERILSMPLKVNAGKRDALAIAAKVARNDLLVFVDSDSFLDPYAIRNLVQPFQDPKMGGVAGRTDVANIFTNWITKMQATRYYIAFRIMKAAEAYFDTVTCLSGPLACYRKDIVMENLDAWLNQKFLGMKATFGDDRSLTNMVLKNHRTTYQDTAICSTIVPNNQKVFLKQQMRWKRSWLRETVVAAKYIWKKEPFAAIFFYIGFAVPFLAPVIVIYNLLYVPITTRIFPTTFLVGILMMSLLMSFAYLLFRRSSIWLFSMLFVIYYEFILLWQMPVAWVTFWKSTWGTRMTVADVAAEEKKKSKKTRDKVRQVQT